MVKQPLRDPTLTTPNFPAETLEPLSPTQSAHLPRTSDCLLALPSPIRYSDLVPDALSRRWDVYRKGGNSDFTSTTLATSDPLPLRPILLQSKTSAFSPLRNGTRTPNIITQFEFPFQHHPTLAPSSRKIPSSPLPISPDNSQLRILRNIRLPSKSFDKLLLRHTNPRTPKTSTFLSHSTLILPTHPHLSIISTSPTLTRATPISSAHLPNSPLLITHTHSKEQRQLKENQSNTKRQEKRKKSSK